MMLTASYKLETSGFSSATFLFDTYLVILTASSFRIWNSSTGILSPPLALFIVMLSKAHFFSTAVINDLEIVVDLDSG